MKKIILLVCFSFFLLSPKADAATLFFVPETTLVGVDSGFYVDVRVDTEDGFINATQSSISYPDSILEVVGIERSDSVFNFWLKEPEYDDGVIDFIGGSAKGLSGSSLQVLRIYFRTIGAGSADLRILESFVTANDGRGTNVLKIIENTTIDVNPEVKRVETIRPTEGIGGVSVELPEKVERDAVEVIGLPKKPELKVPLYSDQEKWHNHKGETIVLWDVSEDIIKIAVSVDNSLNTEPMYSEEELFTGKNLGDLPDGINYIHVQFKNSNGWGETAHYRIAIDTVLPLPFDLKISSLISDNPTPTIEYVGLDTLSGFATAWVSVDDKDFVIATSSPFVLNSQKPGEHIVSVRVFDEAGNGNEESLKFEILPLETPVVDFITKNITSGELFYVAGRSTPNNFIDYRIIEKGVGFMTGTINTDITGKWTLSIEEGLPQGNYKVSFETRDERGAVSYPLESIKLRVSAKVVFSLGFVNLTMFGLVVWLLLFIVLVAGTGYWYYSSSKEKKAAYSVIASRDVVKISKLLGDDLTEIEGIFKQQKSMQRGLRPRLNTVFKRMNKNIDNMKKYLGEAIEKSH